MALRAFLKINFLNFITQPGGRLGNRPSEYFVSQMEILFENHENPVVQTESPMKRVMKTFSWASQTARLMNRAIAKTILISLPLLPVEIEDLLLIPILDGNHSTIPI